MDNKKNKKNENKKNQKTTGQAAGQPESKQPESQPENKVIDISNIKLTAQQTNLLGRSRTQIADLKSANADSKVIDVVVSTQAKKAGISKDIWAALLDSKPARSSTGDTRTDRKESYRSLFNTLTDNYLSVRNEINHVSDIDNISHERAIELLKRHQEVDKALLAHDDDYSKWTGIQPNADRDDFRSLLITAQLPSHKGYWGRYGGGWNDGSKQERGQYDNGRLVPHAKSTGFKRDMVIPTFTIVQSEPEQENTEAENS